MRPKQGGQLGNKGGPGRPSAYKERQDAEFAEEVWKVGKDLDDLKERLRVEPGKKIAARDVFAFLALTAMIPGRRDAALMKLADKMLPDLHEVTGKGGAPLFLPSEILGKRALEEQNADLPPDPEPGGEGQA